MFAQYRSLRIAMSCMSSLKLAGGFFFNAASSTCAFSHVLSRTVEPNFVVHTCNVERPSAAFTSVVFDFVKVQNISCLF